MYIEDASRKRYLATIKATIYFARYQSVSDENANAIERLHVKRGLRICVYIYLGDIFLSRYNTSFECCRNFFQAYVANRRLVN